MTKSLLRILCPLIFMLTAVILLSGCFRKDNNNRSVMELVEHLKKSGLIIEMLTPTVPGIINAQDGIFVRINGKDVQLFKYDTRLKIQADKLDKIASEGKITILAVDFPAVTNGSFIMLNYEGNPEEAKIREAFESF